MSTSCENQEQEPSQHETLGKGLSLRVLARVAEARKACTFYKQGVRLGRNEGALEATPSA